VTISSIRAVARVARRDIARHRWRSLLVMLLVMLPVAAMVAGTAISRTTFPTQEREDGARMGTADLIAYNTTRVELEMHLPAGSIVEPVVSTDGSIVIPGARLPVSVRAMDLEGLAAGMLTLIGGRVPHGNQVAITPAVAEVAGTGLGGRIELADGSAPTVAGLVENPMDLGDRIVVIDPKALEIDETLTTWLVGLPTGVDPQSVVDASTDPSTGQQDVLIQSRESSRLIVAGGEYGSTTMILVLGSLALVEAALIASAAFAVSIRRRQRELGLLAATGATPRQLAGVVLAEGAILGLAACAAGGALGLAGAFALTPWLDELTQRRNPPLVVDLAGIAGPVAVGLMSAMIAALVPARTVAHVPVLLALSGRRPPQSRARRTLWIGLAAIGLAVVMTVIGATVAATSGPAVSDLLLVSGAVLSMLGFGACAPWLLDQLERLAARLPLAGRIALRDTARARSRSSPIVAAIVAGLAVAIAIGAWQSSRDAENLAGWVPSLYPDQIVLSGLAPSAAGELLLAEEGAVSGTRIPDLVLDDPSVFISYNLPDARDAEGELINLVGECQNCNPGAFEPYQVSRINPATPVILAMAGIESAADDLRDGRAVVLTTREMTATRMEILIYRDPTSTEVSERYSLPVRVIQMPVASGILPNAFLPDATIRELGLRETEDDGPYGTAPYVVRYDHTVMDADLEHAQEVASRFPETYADTFSAPVEPGEEFRILTIALVLLFALSVTGIAIALGEAESRPEQRSLLAIGADPRLRRRIAGWRAAVLALLAGVLAVPAGLLPVWGIFASHGSTLGVPTLEIVGAVLALPVLAVASSWLLSRPIPDWNALRGIGAGE
jgi:putative ABC transport system permease protein